MVKRGLLGLILILSFLLLIPFSSAQPPFVEIPVFSEGYYVEFTPLGNYKNGENIQFHAHVYNISNGVRIDNSTTDCVFHLFNRTGEHVINNINMTFDLVGLDWDYEVLGGNFTTNGDYAYLVTCLDSTNELGGFVAVEFRVTTLGDNIETAESVLYALLLIVNLIMFLIFFSFSIIIPFKDETNKEGAITAINKLKYLKLLCIWFTYGIFLWFLTLLTGLTNNYIFFSGLSGMMTNLYVIFYVGGWGFSVLIIWVIFISLWKDILLNKEIVKFGKAFMKEVN